MSRGKEHVNPAKLRQQCDCALKYFQASIGREGENKRAIETIAKHTTGDFPFRAGKDRGRDPPVEEGGIAVSSVFGLSGKPTCAEV